MCVCTSMAGYRARATTVCCTSSMLSGWYSARGRGVDPCAAAAGGVDCSSLSGSAGPAAFTSRRHPQAGRHRFRTASGDDSSGYVSPHRRSARPLDSSILPQKPADPLGVEASLASDLGVLHFFISFCAHSTPSSRAASSITSGLDGDGSCCRFSRSGIPAARKSLDRRLSAPAQRKYCLSMRLLGYKRSSE